ncbi:MAG: alpha/beta hydrolase [Lachnospiraceae bacterium]|nr:alpha/beta hydrolase [Lachnospiraceae bacterium]
MHTWVIVIIIVVCAIVAALIITGVYAGNFAAYRNINMNRFLMNQLAPGDMDKTSHVADLGEEMRDHVDEEYYIKDRDGLRLHAYFIKGDPESDVYVLCSHGYRDPIGGLEFAEKAPIWQSRGYNLLMVDHRAHALSEGKFLSFGLHESDDCIEWLEFLKEKFGEDIRFILHGQSMGAAIVLQMSCKETLPENVKGIIGDCGYTNFYSQCQGLLPVPKFVEAIILTSANVYLRFCHRIDMKKADSLEAVKKASVPILFIHGDGDTFVPVRMSREMYASCSSKDKQLEIFEGATHCMSYNSEPERYTRLAHEFADRILS